MLVDVVVQRPSRGGGLGDNFSSTVGSQSKGLGGSLTCFHLSVACIVVVVA
jgi:hypothetical protein